MPTTKAKEPVLQLTISLAEVVQLQTENAALKKQVVELQAQNKLLQEQIHDITDPVKKANAAAFKNRRGL